MRMSGIKSSLSAMDNCMTVRVSYPSGESAAACIRDERPVLRM